MDKNIIVFLVPHCYSAAAFNLLVIRHSLDLAMALNRICVVLLLIFFCHAVQGSSILALFSSLSFTDHFVFRGYLSQLAQRGHTVVVMTPYPGHFLLPEKERIIELDVGEVSGPFWEEYKKLVTNTVDHYTKMRALNELTVKVAIAQLRSKQMQALFINPNLKFDLVVTEAEVPILYAVAEKYQVPHITITAGPGSITMYESKGCPTHPLLYPDVNTLNYRNLNMWQKYSEISRYVQSKREYYSNYLPLCQVAAEKIMGLKRDLLEVEQDIDMLFVSGSPALIGNRPSPPSVAYVDRLHIRPGLPLSQDFQTIVDSAQKGVIYFSLGAIQESEELSPSILKTLAAAFKEVPYTILWKIANTTMIENLSENVVALPWFPQQELLAHPNVKAFITHGGPRSLEEAVFYETPIIGFPIVKSRKTFINEITRHGAGLIVDPYFLDKDNLVKKINQVASDEKFKQAASLLKLTAQDPVLSGPEHAVWWTEYVLRHQGGRHLRSPSVGVTFFQYYMFDITAFLVAVTSATLASAFYLLRLAVRRVRGRIPGRQELGKFKAL